MVEAVELTTAAKNRVTFKKIGGERFYMELSRPGILRDGAGWIVSDAMFLTAGDVAKLRDLLRPDLQVTVGR